MGASMPRCGRSIARDLPKPICAGGGSPVSIGVARKLNNVSCRVMASPFLMVFFINALMCPTCLSINPFVMYWTQT